MQFSLQVILHVACSLFFFSTFFLFALEHCHISPVMSFLCLFRLPIPLSPYMLKTLSVCACPVKAWKNQALTEVWNASTSHAPCDLITWVRDDVAYAFLIPDTLRRHTPCRKARRRVMTWPKQQVSRIRIY